MTAIPLTEPALKYVKRTLTAYFPDEKSTHLTEALAAACDCKSHAALITRMSSVDPVDPDYVLLDANAFLQRLRTISSSPSLTNSSFDFDALPIEGCPGIVRTISPGFERVDYAKSKRKRAWRNAMVSASNAGIEQRLFTVLPRDNRWPGAEHDETYIYRFTTDGIPAIASVRDIGFDELSIHVAFWPESDGERWIQCANAGFHAGDLFASGWLERRNGAWLQVGNDTGRDWTFNCRKDRLDRVASLMVRPKGYADRGSFMM
ncbi:hypothetical protein [Methyloligella solikamskensis]|uniref:Uncharacterized protein n=1 Tax=Methyloligella solikamskensis TaxID=1177756 RepID=A0ABW3J8N3_9HYPH